IAATNSPFILTDILRGKLGFKGIIITDDMVMEGALIGSESIESACYEAITAGNDILMISRTTSAYNRIWNYLYPKMTNDKQFKQRITESVRRILTIKLDYFKRDNRVALYPDIEAIKNTIPSPEGSKFFLDQAFRSVSIVRDKELPVTIGEETKVLLAAPYRAFLREGKKQIPQADTYYFPFIPEKEYEKGFLNEFTALVKNYDRVIFSLTNKFSLKMLEILENSSIDVTVISSLTPIYLEDVPWVDSAVAVYGTGYESYMAGFAAILGEYIPKGTVPINNIDIQGFSN
ncbi:MAG: glycoside hydrolase family 3 protein, partial [Spirochaetales bacterium]|nr:glycoside hydrolase family 3 protein [Spirochaetales bacterium]